MNVKHIAITVAIIAAAWWAYKKFA